MNCAARKRSSQRIGFLRRGARPPTALIVQYVENHKDELRVEPVGAELQVAPSTYYAARARPPSAREVAEQERLVVIREAHADNNGIYEDRKVHAELSRRGHQIARCTMHRVMRADGPGGISRVKGPRTTVPGHGRTSGQTCSPAASLRLRRPGNGSRTSATAGLAGGSRRRS